jgi:uncharacterized protein (DUF1684 family)
MRSGMKSLAFAIALVASADTSYQTEVEQWRRQREQELRADNGWLTVAGLFWLKEGVNTAGSDASSVVVLPRGPAKFGDFDFQRGQIIFRPASGLAVNVNGKPAAAVSKLKPDTEGNPDQVQLDGLTMFVIHRGDRYAIRLKDVASKFRKQFTGLHWFPVRQDHRITAKFVAYDQPKLIAIPNVLGETSQMPSPVMFCSPSMDNRCGWIRWWKKTTSSSSFAMKPAPKEPIPRAGFSTPSLPKTARCFWISTRPTILPARSLPTPPARSRRSKTGSRSGSRQVNSSSVRRGIS